MEHFKKKYVFPHVLNEPKLLQSKSPEMTANTGLISTTKELVTSYLPISLNFLFAMNNEKENKKKLFISYSICKFCYTLSIFIWIIENIFLISPQQTVSSVMFSAGVLLYPLCFKLLSLSWQNCLFLVLSKQFLIS